MPQMARTGDVFVGICCCKPHKKCVNMVGILVSGAVNCSGENSQACRVGDIGIGACGHPTVIVTGSQYVTIENSSASRVGDVVAGCINGVIVSGTTSTSIGG